MESEEIPVECENLCNSYWIGTISKHFFGVTQFIKKVGSFYWNLLKEVLSKQKESSPKKFNPINYIEELNDKNPIEESLVTRKEAS